MKEEKPSLDTQVKLETPIEESMKYLHLRTYLINAKKIREAWINNSTEVIKQT